MTLRRLLENSAFGPDEIGRMTTAYEGALPVLGLANRTDPITEILAKKIIEIAQTGERDPFRIRARAIADLGIPSMDQDAHTHSDDDQEEVVLSVDQSFDGVAYHA